MIRYRAHLSSGKFIPALNRNLSAQCGLEVTALRFRTVVTHWALEGLDWESAVEVDEQIYPNHIAEFFVGYREHQIHLGGECFPFVDQIPYEMVLLTPGRLRVNYLAPHQPRRTRHLRGRVLHQFSFPTRLLQFYAPATPRGAASVTCAGVATPA